MGRRRTIMFPLRFLLSSSLYKSTVKSYLQRSTQVRKPGLTNQAQRKLGMNGGMVSLRNK